MTCFPQVDRAGYGVAASVYRCARHTCPGFLVKAAEAGGFTEDRAGVNAMLGVKVQKDGTVSKL